MSENKFTEHMEVEKIGTLKPGDIGLGTCDGCEKNIHKFPGVLLQGITEEAAKLLYEKVEIVPEGTKARMAKLEASNAALLEALEKLVKFVEGSGMCFGRIHREVWERSFEVMENAREEIQKAKGENNGL
jgi:hypothetical protein